MLRGDPPITIALTMTEKILAELCDGDLNTLDRFYNWHSTQPLSNELEIMKWSADYRKAELRVSYPMELLPR